MHEVRVPPRNKVLNAEMAERLIRAAWYENLSTPPDKFVLVLDLDGANPDGSLDRFEAGFLTESEAASQHLLGECVYTARVSEDIASGLDPDTIAGRSPSFRKFVDAITNVGFEPRC